MPNYTTNYNLAKPIGTDLYDITVQNSNMDKIDAALNTLVNTTHSLSERGELIPKSSDLNSYTTPGDYFVSGATDAATISNTPTTGAGYRLIVEAGYVPGYIRQYAIGMQGVMFTRQYQTSWSQWVKIIDSNDMANSIHYHSTKQLNSEDLNNVKTPGFYFAVGENTCANSPAATGSAFGLEVVRTAGSYYTQMCYVADVIYVRYTNGSTWQEWKKLIDEDSQKNRGVEIQCGVRNDVNTVGVNITFEWEFSGVPVVVATGGTEVTSVRARDITTKGFRLVSGQDNNDAVQWIATYIS